MPAAHLPPADQDRKGLLDIADHGTLFLDEIGDMGLEVQGPFLKVLEEKQYRRLGDVKLIKSDFRLISATNRNIAQMVGNSQFRQDLLYRINLLTIHLPPLRDRRQDIPAIAHALLKSLNRPEMLLSDEILQLLTGYDWPGNIPGAEKCHGTGAFAGPGRTAPDSSFLQPGKSPAAFGHLDAGR